jgi:uncharacterized coiled-coil protein SlyX
VDAILTTGCPYSGWDLALPSLQQAGLQPAGDYFSRWHDELFDAAGVDDVLDVQRPLQPNGAMAKKASKVFSESPSGPILLADARALWLLDFWADEFSQAKFLLFYTPAEIAIAHMLQSRPNSGAYLDAWKACSQALTSFQRRHRQRAILLDADDACRQPASLVGACQRLGLTLQTPRQVASPRGELPPLERMAAHVLVAAAQPSIQTLRTELEAQSVPVGDSARPLRAPPEELLEIYRQLKAAEQEVQRLENTSQNLESAKREVEQENELLVVQVHQIQEELEHYFLEYQDANRAALARDGKIKDLREQMEGLIAERDKYMSLTAQQEQNIQRLNKQIAELQKSLAWKITAPLRFVLDPLKERLEIRTQSRLLRSSDLFDERWYLAEYGDVASAGVDPVIHYLRFGAKEARNPSPSFHTRFYLENNPDVAASEMNPLVHFLRYGKAEGRRRSP